MRARKIVEQYEFEQRTMLFLLSDAKVKFPIGIKVKSKLNDAVIGEVVDYNVWGGFIQLICKDGDNKTRILCHNAIKQMI